MTHDEALEAIAQKYEPELHDLYVRTEALRQQVLVEQKAYARANGYTNVVIEALKASYDVIEHEDEGGYWLEINGKSYFWESSDEQAVRQAFEMARRLGYIESDPNGGYSFREYYRLVEQLEGE
jgi:hypothetical protein